MSDSGKRQGAVAFSGANLTSISQNTLRQLQWELVSAIIPTGENMSEGSLDGNSTLSMTVSVKSLLGTKVKVQRSNRVEVEVEASWSAILTNKRSNSS